MLIEKESTTGHYKELIKVLGKNYVKSPVESPFDFIHIANKGVNANIIKNFMLYFNLPREDIGKMLNISAPTLYRWLKANKSLDRRYSIKLFEITDLFLYGIEVFGSKENFFKWLNLPNISLGELKPCELIEIPGGISKIRNTIGRIEHGVYS